MSEQTRGVILPFKATARHPIREPFRPMTGNPENGDYLDWFREQKDNDVFIWPDLVEKK